MTLSDIKTLYAYNTWANNKIFEALSQLTDEQYMQDMKSSHGGIHGTLTHLVGAGKVWLARWKNSSDKEMLRTNEISSLSALISIRKTIEDGIDSFINEMSDEKLQELFTLTTAKGDKYVYSYANMLQHLANHSTYHRGQIVTMLRQIGVTPPQTDFSFYLRQQQS
ncbi:MAG: hypothetical protein EPO24_02760 [Bacteroidetes bacterium]|nr:MAG: hypothetical protein EPO24_02760 [Bacteroidota bacterium]